MGSRSLVATSLQFELGSEGYYEHSTAQKKGHEMGIGFKNGLTSPPLGLYLTSSVARPLLWSLVHFFACSYTVFLVPRPLRSVSRMRFWSQIHFGQSSTDLATRPPALTIPYLRLIHVAPCLPGSPFCAYISDVPARIWPTPPHLCLKS